MINLKNIAISYDDNTVVKDLTLRLKQGEIGCLLGASGSGKSTLLQAIAGFKALDRGEITLRDRVVASDSINVAPNKRNVAMVFQDFALFPHLSVADNIAFGLSGKSATQKQQIVDELLSLVGLSGFASRAIHQLSGGQQQRVAVARAIAPEPDLILFDEPFSSLDTELRLELATQVKRILNERQMTAILVTHDHQEAFLFADKIGVLQQGSIQQWDTGFNVYHRPETPYVAEFVGKGRFIEGEITSTTTVNTVFGELTTLHPQQKALGEKVRVLLRPDDIVHDDDSTLKAKVISRQFRGADILFRLEVPIEGCNENMVVHCISLSHHDHKPGESIGIKFDLQHVICF
ncbi:MAG: ABC transporter ATP-binding protein [Aestuariibacter sp.]